MVTGWRYRILGGVGAALLTLIGVYVANHPVAQVVFTTYVPLFWRLDPVVLTNDSLQLAMLVSAVIVVLSLVPLFKPQPRRILDTVMLVQQRVFIAGLALATLGFFKWSHRLPRATLVMLIGILGITLPAWFVFIRKGANGTTTRAVIVGDDYDQIVRIVNEADIPVLGYLCPPSTYWKRDETQEVLTTMADGGSIGLERLGGLSNLEEMLVELDIDTVILAFSAADRGDFFGTLDTCHEHGVKAKVHREYVDDVLTAESQVGTLVDVDVEPWDPQDYFFKRAFDVLIAGAALLVLSPIILLIILAILLERSGPVFFTQERTYLFGETFTIRKFRTLLPVPGGEVGTEIEDNRRTLLGQILRTTHLDEIPQLWSILVGEMSVVGPRPAQTALESAFAEEAIDWRKRWFVKPGLTGLAQINNATSSEPKEKIRYDLQYIRNQSLTFDLQILIRQLWIVFGDTIGLFRGDESAKK